MSIDRKIVVNGVKLFEELRGDKTLYSVKVDTEDFSPEEWEVVKEVMESHRGKKSHFYVENKDDFTLSFNAKEAAERFIMKIKTRIFEMHSSDCAQSIVGPQSVGNVTVGQVFRSGQIQINLPKGQNADVFLAALNLSNFSKSN